MAQLNKGTTYSTGDQVNATNLNALVDNAVLLQGAVDDQISASALTTSDSTLLSQSLGLRKATLGQMLALVPSPDLTPYLKADGSVAMTTGQQLTLGSTAQIAPLNAVSLAHLQANYLPLSGGTLSGALTLPANPVSSLQAATKQYADNLSEKVTISKLNQRQRSDTMLRQMVLTSDGGLIVWGRNYTGTTGTFNNGDNATIPQSRPYFNIAIPVGVTVVDFASTYCHSVCVLSNGWVYTTGNNDSGQLGHGDTTHRYIFTRVEYFVTNNISISAVYASNSKQGTNYGGTFFQTPSGDLYSCGYNSEGALGVGDTVNKSTPTKLTAISNVSKLYLTDWYVQSAIALKTNGDLYGWGYNAQGQLGLNDTTRRTSPTLITSSVSKADISSGTVTGAIGATLIVLKTNGDVYTTGYNPYGQLGLGDTTQRLVLTKVSTLSGIVDIGIAGGFAATAYAVSSARRLYTWGYNGHGSIGDGTTTNVYSPYNVSKWVNNLAQDPPFVGKSFSVFLTPNPNGYTNICVIDSDGRIFMTGYSSGMMAGTNGIVNLFNEIIPTFSSQSEKASSAVFMQSDTDIAISILTDQGRVYSAGRNAYACCNAGVDPDSPSYRYVLSRQMLYT